MGSCKETTRSTDASDTHFFLCSTFCSRLFHTLVLKGFANFQTSFWFPTNLEENCYFLYFLKAVPLSFWHFKVFVLFYLPHLVMTSALGRMPLTLQPFFPAASHHNFSVSHPAFDRAKAFVLQFSTFKYSSYYLQTLHPFHCCFQFLFNMLPHSDVLSLLKSSITSLKFLAWITSARICKYTCVHTYGGPLAVKFCTKFCTIPRTNSKVSSSLWIPRPGVSQRCRSWRLRGLGCRFPPIIFPTLQPHTLYYYILFLSTSSENF